jgi:hypothetical protein
MRGERSLRDHRRTQSRIGSGEAASRKHDWC